ncbi:MAG TPA: hypothetical protein VH054_20225 [Polyangiaceae bacterium]|jgi:hypothetical protein|nr:hypothetical protein [Polyangiaceae bacterium]
MKRIAVASICLVACSSSSHWGESSSSTSSDLSGCHGTASSTEPADGEYYLTSFGFTSDDDGIMSCGEYTKDGSWYYAASRQRFGCGSRIQIEANGKCVVAETDDYGPDVCVENAAGRPIIDASPLVSEALFGTKSAGWSDRYAIRVTQVDGSTPLGLCSSNTPPPPPPSVTCYSHTLDQDEPEGACVQSVSDDVWYQCTASGWVSGVDGDNGPIGPCTADYPL